MNSASFAETKRVVVQWISTNKARLEKENITVEIIENNKERLYIILDFKECMAAITVAEPEFAPYRFVSFEAADIINGIPKIVHAWYDGEQTTSEDITKNLNETIYSVSEYIRAKTNKH